MMAGHRVSGKADYMIDNRRTQYTSQKRVKADKTDNGNESKRTNPNTPTFFIISIPNAQSHAICHTRRGAGDQIQMCD